MSMGLIEMKMKENNKRKGEKIISNEDKLANSKIKIYDIKSEDKKSYFGALRGVGSMIEEDKMKGQLEE